MSEFSRRKRASLVVSLVMIVTLSGCAGQGVAEPAGDPASSDAPVAGATSSGAEATPTPTATTAPSPSPSPSPVNTDDPSTWVIEFDGVGPLRLGNPLDGAEALVPTFTREVEETCPPVIFLSATGFPGITIPDPYGSGVIKYIVVAGSHAAPTASPLRTSAGIGIGATFDELEAAYPDFSVTEINEVPHYAVSNGAGKWITFGLNENELVYDIVVSSSRDIPSEFCG